MDGSQKLPQRLLGTIRDRLARGLPVPRAVLGVAAWMRYVTGIDEQGREIDVSDPLAARLGRISQSAGGAPDLLVSGLLSVTEVFGDDLPRNQSFRALLISQLTSLLERGALETVRELIRQLHVQLTLSGSERYLYAWRPEAWIVGMHFLRERASENDTTETTAVAKLKPVLRA